jgi:hypothetical protein
LSKNPYHFRFGKVKFSVIKQTKNKKSHSAIQEEAGKSTI